MTEVLLLCLFAFLAGFIDAIVGGGGLIQLPALLIVMPNLAIPTAIGTNKLASIAGTITAIPQYASRVQLNWRVVLPGSSIAFLSSFLGARIVASIDSKILRPLILVLLITVAIYTFIKKDFGTLHQPRLNTTKQIWLGIFVGGIIGFYDGFFGPGTGSFLIFAFISLFGFDFLNASAASKVFNTATNLSALLYFAVTDRVLYQVALPMAVCNIIGSITGTRLAILKGSGFVRSLFLVVVTGIIVKLAFDTFYKF
jgi:uncharacterized protein